MNFKLAALVLVPWEQRKGREEQNMSFNDSSVNVLEGKIKNSLRDKQMRDYIRIFADSVVQNNEYQKRELSHTHTKL